MEHAAAKQGSFYFHPSRDVLWLSADFTDERHYLEHLMWCYGEQLNSIKTLLAEESEWDGNSHRPYVEEALTANISCQTIIIRAFVVTLVEY